MLPRADRDSHTYVRVMLVVVILNLSLAQMQLHCIFIIDFAFTLNLAILCCSREIRWAAIARSCGCKHPQIRSQNASLAQVNATIRLRLRKTIDSNCIHHVVHEVSRFCPSRHDDETRRLFNHNQERWQRPQDAEALHRLFG